MNQPLALRPYQKQARDWLLDRPRAALFLDMGLGKAASTLAALSPQHLPALVVAPKRVAEHVWDAEASLWRPELRVGVAKGNPAQRADVLARQDDLTVLGQDNLRDAIWHDGSMRRPWRTVILDESSGYKSRASVRWKTARRLMGARHLWELTGTPSPNGLLDLWAPTFLLDQGKRLGSGITKYRERYFTPGRQLRNGVITGWNLRPGAEQRIHALLDDICLSMTGEGRIQLPPVTFNRVPVPLPPSVTKLYRQFARDLLVDLRLLGGEVHTAHGAGVLTGKLSQVAAGFLYKDDADLRPDDQVQPLHRAKLEALKEIVEASSSPVLVFYEYRWEREQILKLLPEAATVETPGWYERWNAGGLPVLLCHPAQVGHGLNLQHGGHTIVWTTMTWNLEHWLQANKRLARSGQRHPVVIHVLQAAPVDTAKWDRLNDKKSVQDALMTALEAS